ncbi:Cys-Gln thioester bond-forming surface protein [Kitasatospora sp. NPDC058170]|uniref:Cys-Gln thioester bond-forming surface protein n=1 Tax=Kitasatospora sp. NPDC058170 TaxID=3346364 RepID=UPI0036D91C7D
MLAAGATAGSGFATAHAVPADSRSSTGAVTAVVEQPHFFGGVIRVNGGEVTGELSELGVGDGDGGLFAYALDLGAEPKTGSVYKETRWSDVPRLKDTANMEKVNWILRHSYPSVPPSDLSKLVGGSIAAYQAAAATQAAVWHFSEGVAAVPEAPVAARLTEYLVSHAGEVTEPGPSLTLAPSTVTGDSGAVLGPIKVTSAADSVDVSLDTAAVSAGTALTDKDGAVVSDAGGKLTRPAKDGDLLYVKSPDGAKPGSATISAAASLKVPVGRAFVSPGSQSLIVADSSTVGVTADAKVDWAPAVVPPVVPPSGTASPSPTPSPTPSRTPAPGASPAPTTAPSTPSLPADPTPSPTSDQSVAAAAAATAPTTAGGALAATGAGAPFGPIVGVAVVLILVGGILCTRSRRRRRGRTTR